MTLAGHEQERTGYQHMDIFYKSWDLVNRLYQWGFKSLNWGLSAHNPVHNLPTTYPEPSSMDQQPKPIEVPCS